MKVIMYGVSLETVSEQDIARYRLSAQDKANHLIDIKQFAGVEEVLLLTSEFQNEYYLYVDEAQFEHGDFLRYLANYAEKSLKEVILETYSKFADDVMKHLLAQISGQERDNYGQELAFKDFSEAILLAQTSQTIGNYLQQLFQQVLIFNFKLYDNSGLNPLLTASDRWLKQYVEQNTSLQNVVIMGRSYETLYRAFLILYLTDASVIFCLSDNAQSKQLKAITELINTAQQRLKIAECGYCYRLATADLILMDAQSISPIQLSEMIEEVRQTPKQVTIISNLDSEAISKDALAHFKWETKSDLTASSYNDEQREEAHKLLTELIVTFSANELNRIVIEDTL